MDGSTKDLTFALVCGGGDAPPPVPVLGEPSYVVAAMGGWLASLEWVCGPM